MPDGELADHIPQLREAIQELLADTAISTIVTLDEDGYDHHPDHIAVHDAVTGLTPDGGNRQRRLWLLDSAHQGEHIVTGDPKRKLGAMACHTSQFDLVNDAAYWTQTSPYAPLFTRETYRAA